MHLRKVNWVENGMWTFSPVPCIGMQSKIMTLFIFSEEKKKKE